MFSRKSVILILTLNSLFFLDFFFIFKKCLLCSFHIRFWNSGMCIKCFKNNNYEVDNNNTLQIYTSCRYMYVLISNHLWETCSDRKFCTRTDFCTYPKKTDSKIQCSNSIQFRFVENLTGKDNPSFPEGNDK